MLFPNGFHSAERTIDRSNAKLGKGMNHFALFGVFFLRMFRGPWKTASQVDKTPATRGLHTYPKYKGFGSLAVGEVLTLTVKLTNP